MFPLDRNSITAVRCIIKWLTQTMQPVGVGIRCYVVDIVNDRVQIKWVECCSVVLYVCILIPKIIADGNCWSTGHLNCKMHNRSLYHWTVISTNKLLYNCLLDYYWCWYSFKFFLMHWPHRTHSLTWITTWTLILFDHMRWAQNWHNCTVLTVWLQYNTTED